MSKLILFNKPYQVLSQFTDETGRKTLANYIHLKGIYPAGRLDYDSEGLLLLTDDGRLQSLISHPKYKLTKTYWAQIEGTVNKSHCQQLMAGVDLKDGPAKAIHCKPIYPPQLWDRVPPIRERKTVADSWLEISIAEGRNRQVRRMTAAVGLPTLRLVRSQIGSLNLQQLPLGEIKLLTGRNATEIYTQFLKETH
ncbi:MAG: pseudouridine synthase [Porticoccaceae bacterium]